MSLHSPGLVPHKVDIGNDPHRRTIGSLARLGSWVHRSSTRMARILVARGPREMLNVVAAAARDRFAQFLDYWFDYVSSVSTCGREYLYRADGPPESNPHYLDYQPTPVRTVRALLHQLGPDIHKSTFIDFGSGKGRVLLIASEFGFRRVIGVEFDPRLHRIASENIRKYRGRRICTDVTSVLGRAEEFPLPGGDLVLYFFHPFESVILERILERVVAAHQEQPRTILLVFFRATHAAIVERFDVFRRLPERPLPFDLVRASSEYRDGRGLPYDTAVFVTTR
jgi:SAM-dependent methyltransferase